MKHLKNIFLISVILTFLPVSLYVIKQNNLRTS